MTALECIHILKKINNNFMYNNKNVVLSLEDWEDIYMDDDCTDYEVIDGSMRIHGKKELYVNYGAPKEEFEKEFEKGFFSVTDVLAPEYFKEDDMSSPNPWFAPWLYLKSSMWFVPDISAKNMGKIWGSICLKEIKENLKF